MSPITGKPITDPYAGILPRLNVKNPAFIGDNFVHPDFRHQGIGQSHVAKAEELAREKGADAIIASIYRGTDESSEKFARQAGFEPTGEVLEMKNL